MLDRGRLRKSLIFALSASLLFLSAHSFAEDSFKFSGFGSVGVVHENLKNAGFVRNAVQPQDESNNTSYLTDTILGLQANYTLSPQWELVTQMVLRDQKNPTLNRSIEWANMRWRPLEQTDIRFGRIGSDPFLLSDYRSVGFAQTWARPPNEFYGWNPIYSIDGLDGTYHFDTGATHWHMKGQFGSSSAQLPMGGDATYSFKADNIRILNLRADKGPWQMMASLTKLEVTSEAVPSALTSGLQQLASNAFVPATIRGEAQQLRSNLWTKDANVTYKMLGASYQDGVWQFQAEFAKVTSNSLLLPSGKTGYIMAGRRFGDLTPYAIVSAFRPDHNAAKAQYSWAAAGNTAVQTQTAAIAATNTYHIDQSSFALGLRWDVTSKTALKVQIDRKRIGANGYGLWQIDNTTQGNTAQRANVFSATLDFVF